MSSIFRLVLLAGAAGMISGAAFAQDYPSCAQARDIVARAGAAVIRTAPNIYDRYVADRGFCQPTESAILRPTPTWDAPGCFIGYVCKEVGIGDEF